MKSPRGFLFVTLPFLSLVVSLLMVRTTAGNQTEQLFIPFVTKPYCVPTLISPEEGSIMDNGDDGSIVWEFTWSECPGAGGYLIYVKLATATSLLVNHGTLVPRYVFASVDTYIAEHNLQGWTWKVRASTGHELWPWSQVRTFDVEPFP